MGGVRLFPLFALALAFLMPVGTAYALDLNLPGEATLTREIVSPADTYFLPIGPFSDGELPTRELEGSVTQQAWRIEGDLLTTLQLVTPLRDQLSASGYEIMFDCVGPECGGFDFRFNTSVLPAPDMFVDLLDFRFLTAQNVAEPGAEYITVLVSRSGTAGYVQLTVVGVEDLPFVEPVVQPTPTPEPTSHDTLIDQLLSQGHVVLSDLEFATGSATLTNGSFASLDTLAAFLKSDETRRIALVGHTDTVGGLEDNIALSRRRAASVLERLAESHDVPRNQMESNGMGYLAPIAPNTTAEGREANRRVEAVLLNTE